MGRQRRLHENPGSSSRVRIRSSASATSMRRTMPPGSARKPASTTACRPRAEWEYAARGAKKTAWPWGNDAKASGCASFNSMDSSGHKKYPINDALSCDDRFTTLPPVGSFPANAFGVHDMLGNVWELVSDCWHADYKGAPADGASWQEDSCQGHPMRGGAWLENIWGHPLQRALALRGRRPGNDDRLPPRARSRLRSPSAFG